MTELNLYTGLFEVKASSLECEVLTTPTAIAMVNVVGLARTSEEFLEIVNEYLELYDVVVVDFEGVFRTSADDVARSSDEPLKAAFRSLGGSRRAAVGTFHCYDSGKEANGDQSSSE